MLLYSYHPAKFDIFANEFDPTKGQNCKNCYDYMEKLSFLYSALGIVSGLWTRPTRLDAMFVKFSVRESGNYHEWILQVAEHNIAGYVDETKWDAFVSHPTKLKQFTAYSKTPKS